MNKKGYALITVVLVMVVFSLFLSVILKSVFIGARTAVDDFNYGKAFSIAEAGKNYTIKYVGGFSDWALIPGFPLSKSFAGGVFTVAVVSATEDIITIESTGQITKEGKTYRSKIRFWASKSGLTSLGNYALYSFGGATGDHTMNINNNVTINGNIFTSVDMSIGSNVDINGSAYASGSITSGSNVTVTGTRAAGVTAPPPPTVDATYYVNLINYAATFPAGNLNLLANNTYSFSGITYVNGNFTLNNNVRVNVNAAGATVVVNGSVTMSNNVIVGNGFTVIAKNNITLDNNVDIGSDCFLFSLSPTSTITLGNNAEVGSVGIGNGSTIMSMGDVEMNNNAPMYGLIYAGGTVSLSNNCTVTGAIIAGFIDTLSNNATLTLSGGAVDYSAIIGLSSGISPGSTTGIYGWQEVY